jgi:hypothetical protein
MDYKHKTELIRLTQKNALSDNADVREYIQANNIPVNDARELLPWNII